MSSTQSRSRARNNRKSQQEQINDLKSQLGQLSSARKGGRRRWTNRRPTSRSRGWNPRNRMPAAYTRNYYSNSKLLTTRGAPILVCQEIFPLKQISDKVINFTLPMIPSRWVGTRAAVLSSTFTAFRPLDVTIIYQPAVGTNYSGNVAIGTVFDGSSMNILTREGAMTSLPATNGGFITAVYQPHSAKIGLQTNLRANNFPLYNVDSDDIPFWIVASTTSNSANGTVLGNLVVRYKCSLKNPATQPANPTAALNITGEIEHDDNNNQTTLRIPVASIVNQLVADRDYLLSFNEPLLNATNQQVIRQLQPVGLNCVGTDNDDYVFSLDPGIINPADVICSLIGSSNSVNF